MGRGKRGKRWLVVSDESGRMEERQKPSFEEKTRFRRKLEIISNARDFYRDSLSRSLSISLISR